MAYKKLKYWFDEELAKLLADKIRILAPHFNQPDFMLTIGEQVPELELKDRVEVIADQLHFFLGENYATVIPILTGILGPENEAETGMFTNFYWVMPIAKYVEKYGLDHYELSMTAIAEITKRNTGEFTIRPYLERFPEETLAYMNVWSLAANVHLRRLASEGGRPRLPWAKKLDQFIQDPSPLFPILDNLKDDSSKFVQKSVANCLNDILKDNPERGKHFLEQWHISEMSKARTWIIKHALRTLVKQKDPWAEEIVGTL